MLTNDFKQQNALIYLNKMLYIYICLCIKNLEVDGNFVVHEE